MLNDTAAGTGGDAVRIVIARLATTLVMAKLSSVWSDRAFITVKTGAD